MSVFPNSLWSLGAGGQHGSVRIMPLDAVEAPMCCKYLIESAFGLNICFLVQEMFCFLQRCCIQVIWENRKQNRQFPLLDLLYRDSDQKEINLNYDWLGRRDIMSFIK